VAKTTQERQQEAREAKLEHMNEQVSAGTLVIREMTAAERKKWAKRQDALTETSTPQDRARRDAVLENRRRRQRRS
jgi:hypothetical protein